MIKNKTKYFLVGLTSCHRNTVSGTYFRFLLLNYIIANGWSHILYGAHVGTLGVKTGWVGFVLSTHTKKNHLDVYGERLMATLSHGGDTWWSFKGLKVSLGLVAVDVQLQWKNPVLCLRLDFI